MSSKLFFTPELNDYMNLLGRCYDSNTYLEGNNNPNIDIDYLLILGLIASTDNGYWLTDYGNDWMSQRVSIPLFIIIENNHIIGCSTQLISEYGKVFPSDYNTDDDDMFVFEESIKINK